MSGKGLASESETYRKRRAELLEAEIALKDQLERVAELRRQLPLDTELDDYVLHEGPAELPADEPIREVRLSELLSDPHESLILYHFMYGGAQKDPCPMCSMWIDGFNAVVRHLRQRAGFAIVAQAEIAELRAWARTRGWSGLRLLSSAGSSFKTDLRMQDAEGRQFPGVSVFKRGADGGLLHFYSGSALLGKGHWRGLDLYTPVWNLLDLTPEGRGDWFPSLEYPT